MPTRDLQIMIATTTTGILSEAHNLQLGNNLILEFDSLDTLRKAASRVTCHSRFHRNFKSRRYSTTQIIGVSQGSTVHYLLKIERTQ